jgi:ribose 5-phosphate isomerase A
MKTSAELKHEVAQAVLAHFKPDPNQVVGMGTGSTVNALIDALAQSNTKWAGAVATSESTQARLKAAGMPVYTLDQIDMLPIYIDGADEIDPQGCMTKGGGGALTLEKIVAAQAKQFVCVADESKLVSHLGAFPLPIEIIPAAYAPLQRRLQTFKGGQVRLRAQKPVSEQTSDRAPSTSAGAPTVQPFVTAHGLWILDVAGWTIDNPLALEKELSTWPGVVTVGVFAQQKAHVALIGTQAGVQTLKFES